jgi:hypothetical protein
MMSIITSIEIDAFLSLFNRGGYVLNFSTSKFNVFTQNSVGIPLCSCYKLSKGQSLTTFVNEAPQNTVIKLLSDLLEYYEAHYVAVIEVFSRENKQYQQYYKKCRAVIDNINASATPFMVAGEILKQRFSSEYIENQIDLMLNMQTENPTEAIGKSRELIESCCKTILEKNSVPIDKVWSISKLVKETAKLLKVSVDDISVGSPESSIIQAILGNLSGIVGNIAELRNAYGSGHGKSASYKGLTVRHAKLAVGSSITLVNYLWDTYEWRQSTDRKGNKNTFAFSKQNSNCNPPAK